MANRKRIKLACFQTKEEILGKTNVAAIFLRIAASCHSL
jgi:hypothetical protein